MAITAALVKELRERTGAGMMECKKALMETDGDVEAAIESMRKSGMAKADKKAGRIAAEGLISIKTNPASTAAAMVEINCETDFVAKGEDFIQFCDNVCAQVLVKQPSDLAALMDLPISDSESTTIEQTRRALIAKIGENMSIRRFVFMKAATGIAGTYSHGSRIGVIVDLEGGHADLGKDIAMHVAASNPQFTTSNDVAAEVINKEKEIFAAQAKESGKPDDIIEKMVVGRINKFINEITLYGQPFVKDSDMSIEKLLASAKASVNSFHRFEVGEGIDKKEENFVEEVMAQVRGD